MMPDSTAPPTKRYTVGLLIFNRVDVLDFAGPIEIFSHVSLNKNPDDPDRVYECLTISRERTVRAADSLTVRAGLLVDEALSLGKVHDLVKRQRGMGMVLHSDRWWNDLMMLAWMGQGEDEI